MQQAETIYDSLSKFYYLIIISNYILLQEMIDFGGLLPIFPILCNALALLDITIRIK
jgi:hypothetical protein